MRTAFPLMLLCSLLLLLAQVRAICFNHGEKTVTISFSDVSSTVGWTLTDIDGTDLTLIKKGDFQGWEFCLDCAELMFHVFDLSENGYSGTYNISYDGQVVVENEVLEELANAHLLSVDCQGSTAAPSVSCNEGSAKVEVILDVDSKPEETVWQMISLEDGTVATGEASGTVALSGDAVSSIAYTTTAGGGVLCLECDKTYIFSIQDCGGDGMCCDYGYGRYSVVENDVNQVASGGEFAYTERTFFTTQACPFT